jgi:Na+-transporting methylmalonyl-CoA/oxaloacetate decarboxylase gamma subunit
MIFNSEFVKAGVARVIDGEALAISITGMVIVFSALAFISMFIGVLPRILSLVARVFPDESTKSAADDDRVVIAIGAALHHRKYRQTERQGA